MAVDFSPLVRFENSITLKKRHGEAAEESRQMRLSNEDLKNARKRLLQMHFESGVGHIGGNLSALDAMMLLHHEYLHTDKEPFILSKGHAAGALYASLWSKGLLSDEDRKQFHREETRLPAPSPAFGIPGVLFVRHGKSRTRLVAGGGHGAGQEAECGWQPRQLHDLRRRVARGIHLGVNDFPLPPPTEEHVGTRSARPLKSIRLPPRALGGGDPA